MQSQASASKGGASLSYTYDVDGLRATKTVNGEEHTYIYNGGKLTLEKYGTKLIEYLYTPDGQPYSLRYSTQSGAQNTWSAYYYIVNQQGDVVALTNATGSVVAKYSYDAWGKVTSVRDASNNIISSSTHIGNINPIRYRGYYYDSETELYYVSSRYYDPEICRFINPDDVDLLGENGDFASLNLFTYCGNNPITRADDGGEFWHIVVGAAIGGIIGAASAAASGGDAIDIAIGFLAGAGGGALAASGAGVFVQAAGSAAWSSTV